MPKIKPRRAQRAAPLQDTDYDHEISLVNHATEFPAPQSGEPEPGLGRATISEPGLDPGPSSIPGSPHLSPRQSVSGRPSTEAPSISKTAPTVEVEEPTPGEGLHQADEQPLGGSSLESEIDILWENERGGFLCGIPLFSSKALGNLDPPPWTNRAQRPSPTDITTAQVPDPSWEWAWPEWRVNHDEGVDEHGWEYSFAFAKKFSWHKARWWNSFVRRRAWIRKRVKKAEVDLQDPHLLTSEYFRVEPAARLSHTSSRVSRVSRGSRTSRTSMASSHATSKPSMSHVSRVSTQIEEDNPDIEDIETLMDVLRCSRIDREKLEAVESFLTHGGEELVDLQEHMHGIMALFVFQASRRVLLSKMTEVYDETLKEKESNDTPVLQRKADDLKEAVKHADEEVRRLEYWSDVKGMVEDGHSRSAVDRGKGWDKSWQGVDNSGPAEPDTSQSQD